MKIIDLTPRTPAWLDWRRQGITATDAAIVLGLSPYKTLWRLWAEKKGIAAEPSLDNPHVRRGIDLEDTARRKFEELYNTLLLPVCGESEENPVLRASFDGITDNGEPVEIKCPATKTFQQIREKGMDAEAFRLYLPQIQHQLYVSGAEEGRLAVYADGNLLVFKVERDDQMIQEIVRRSLEFWEAVEQGQEPPLDKERDVFVPEGGLAEQWAKLAATYREVCRELERAKGKAKALEDTAKDLELWFVQAMGDFVHAEWGGVRVKRWLQKGAVDFKAALHELLPEVTDDDLERFRKEASERFRVTVVE